MEGFSYHNIFDTKGIEYLVVIAFLLLMIPFGMALNRKPVIRQKLQKAIGIFSVSFLNIPRGIFYTRNHTWAYMEKSGTARIGVDDFLLRITGNAGIRLLRDAGQPIRKGELLAEIGQNGKSLQILSPVSGEIVGFNPELRLNPGLPHDDPYGKGWIFDIKPSDWQGEISSFYLADGAIQWLKKEFERYRDFLSVHIRNYQTESTHVVLQDGGEITENSLADFPAEVWKGFQNEFLNS